MVFWNNHFGDVNQKVMLQNTIISFRFEQFPFLKNTVVLDDFFF